MMRSTNLKENFFNIADYMKKYVKQNLGGNIDFEKLADSLGYSYDRIRHIFKEQVGVSPVQYLMNQRITKAKELLTDKKMTIGSIAKVCGFNDASNFNALFKARLNMNPLDYRKILQKDREDGKGVSNFEDNGEDLKVI